MGASAERRPRLVAWGPKAGAGPPAPMRELAKPASRALMQGSPKFGGNITLAKEKAQPELTGAGT
jgi:hypothetical protein